MTKVYITISAIIFALVAIGHVARLVQGWDVQIAGTGIAMSVSWGALIVSGEVAPQFQTVR